MGRIRSVIGGWRGGLIGAGIALAVLIALAGGSGEEGSDAGRSPRAERHAGSDPGRAGRDRREASRRGGAQRDGAGERDRGSGGSGAGDPGRRRPPGIPAEAKRTVVTEVTDGDTIELAALGAARLIGIDTPEVYFGAECYGAEASAYTRKRLPAGTTVYYLHGTERRDRYGRDLVYLWLRGGTFFNAELAKEGYAVPLTIPPNVEYASLFRRLAAAAREAGRGLWARSTCGGDADAPADGGGARGGGGSGGSGGGGSGRGGSGGGAGGGSGCEPGYTPCVPTYPPDADCADLDGPIAVRGSDPHGLDGDGDGRACE